MPNDDFCLQRLAAAKMFAQTMIVVDDEASLEPIPEPTSNNNAGRPGRRDQAAASENKAAYNGQDLTHALDAKSLVDKAMEIGLVCSVLKHRREDDQERLKTRVLKAAMRVDIVCLDWKIHRNKGETARLLIKEIVRHDQEQNGRLRLIAIYSAERGRKKNLKKVKDSFDEAEQSRMKLEISEDGREICSAVGLKIVYLFKKHGTSIRGNLAIDQISESELPDRLLREFSNLSEGLLSNVALGTIAKIRDVTHKVVGRFNGDMDGPYFHHRATIRVPDEAEAYAVDIVLSELSSAIKIQNIGRDVAGLGAIKNRVKSIAQEQKHLRLFYGSPNNVKQTDIIVENVIQMILGGCKNAHDLIKLPEKPSVKDFNKNFTSLFVKDPKEAEILMKEFAVLTSIRSHLGDYGETLQTSCPELGLGAIVKDPRKRYWLCLQASCDSIHLELNVAHAFLFAPLEEGGQPDHIVPLPTITGKRRFIGLRVPDKGYTQVRSFEFRPSSRTKTVLAERSERNGDFYFEDEAGQKFIWIAQMKQRRALRASENIGRQMTRIGFDEFEPFRV